MAKHDKAYDQVSRPEAGTTGEHASKDEALGNPGRFTRNTPKPAECDSDAELDELRMKQLDTNPTDLILGNRYQGN